MNLRLFLSAVADPNAASPEDVGRADLAPLVQMELAKIKTQQPITPGHLSVLNDPVFQLTFQAHPELQQEVEGLKQLAFGSLLSQASPAAPVAGDSSVPGPGEPRFYVPQ